MKDELLVSSTATWLLEDAFCSNCMFQHRNECFRTWLSMVCLCALFFVAGRRKKKPMHHEVPVASSSSSNIVPSLRVEAIQGPLPLLSLLKIAGNGNHTTILSLKHNSAPGKVRQWFRSFHLVEALASWHASRALIRWRDKARSCIIFICIVE